MGFDDKKQEQKFAEWMAELYTHVDVDNPPAKKFFTVPFLMALYAEGYCCEKALNKIKELEASDLPIQRQRSIMSNHRPSRREVPDIKKAMKDFEELMSSFN